jgi:hypothetical protein
VVVSKGVGVARGEQRAWPRRGRAQGQESSVEMILTELSTAVRMMEGHLRSECRDLLKMPWIATVH